MKFSKKENYLIERDPKLGKIMYDNGHLVFKPNSDHQFDSLVGIVVSQFISTKAANSIFKNIRENFNSEYLNEKQFQNLNIDQIKNLGLSTNKAKTIKELSELFINESFGDLTKSDSNDLYPNLINVFGIGPWSVNMYEIFCMGKFDVFSSKDAGLRLAMNNSGMVSKNSEWISYEKYAENWSPYKTIASLHLWKTVD